SVAGRRQVRRFSSCPRPNPRGRSTPDMVLTTPASPAGGNAASSRSPTQPGSRTVNRIFSLRRALCAAAGAGWLAAAAAGAPPAAQDAARSPYAGEETRAIKSLSAEDIAE